MMASAMRSDVVARAAILQVLADAPADRVSCRDRGRQPSRRCRLDRCHRARRGRPGPWVARLARHGRRASRMAIRDPDRAERDIVVFGFADGLDAHATARRRRLAAGGAERRRHARWPRSRRPPPSGSGSRSAQQLTLQGSGVDGAPVPVRIVGRYEPLDRRRPVLVRRPAGARGPSDEWRLHDARAR